MGRKQLVLFHHNNRLVEIALSGVAIADLVVGDLVFGIDREDGLIIAEGLIIVLQGEIEIPEIEIGIDVIGIFLEPLL